MDSFCPVAGPGTTLVENGEDLSESHHKLVAVLCHDLRTLLTNINSVAEMLRDENPASTDEPKQAYLDLLVDQSRRISDFLDKVLDIHRLETDRFRLQMRPLPVCLLVESTVRQWQTRASQQKIRLALPTRPLWVWGDENAVQCVLDNLLDNAVKYSPAGTGIEVSVETAAGEVVVSVRDGGPGIPRAEQDKIFESYYRRAQGGNGHGLGLYMCKMLVKAMGGAIGVDSQPGLGSCFRFTLPVTEDHCE